MFSDEPTVDLRPLNLCTLGTCTATIKDFFSTTNALFSKTRLTAPSNSIVWRPQSRPRTEARARRRDDHQGT
jgi:hypothetical protein